MKNQELLAQLFLRQKNFPRRFLHYNYLNIPFVNQNSNLVYKKHKVKQKHTKGTNKVS
jgi:hypothetical protein